MTTNGPSCATKRSVCAAWPICRRPFTTEGDLFLEELLSSTTVRDIMSGDPITVTAKTPVLEAARRMTRSKIHGCPVVDTDGKFIAMITTFDIARWVGSLEEPATPDEAAST